MPDRRDGGAGSPSGPRRHDPLAGVAGAAPARSALSLRAVLAGFGLVVFVALTVVGVLVEAPGWIVVLCALVALSALVDLWVIARRRAGQRSLTGSRPSRGP